MFFASISAVFAFDSRPVFRCQPSISWQDVATKGCSIYITATIPALCHEKLAKRFTTRLRKCAIPVRPKQCGQRLGWGNCPWPLRFFHQAKIPCFLEGVSSQSMLIQGRQRTVATDLLKLLQLQKATAIHVVIVEGEVGAFAAREGVQDMHRLRIRRHRSQEELLEVQLAIAIAIDGIEVWH